MKKLLFLLILVLGCGDEISKSAEALDVNTLMAAPTYTYTDCAAEWAACKFTGSQTVRFGDTVKGVDYYVTKPFTAGNLYPGTGITCRNDVFGKDPHPGSLTKRCALQGAAVVPPVGDVYTQCAVEWADCSFTGTKKVRFGNPGKYVYGTFKNTVRCRSDVFGSDPDVGFAKTCAYTDVASLDAGAPVSVDASVPKDASVVVPVRDASITPPVVDAGGPVVVPPVTGKRPSYNKGIGFYVLNGKLYDANDNEFRIRGTNKTHQDNSSVGLGNTKSNTTRWIVYFVDDPDRTIRDLQSPSIGGSTVTSKAVQIPGFWDGTCKTDLGTFNTMINRWIRDAAKFQTIERFTIINLANEWGDDTNEAAWRDAYVSAIPKIRAAGWHGAILVDAPGCGQHPKGIINQGAAILAADPEKNIVFSVHIYGYWRDTVGGVPTQWNDTPDLHYALSDLKNTGLPVIVGEFGPGRNIGASPTMILPERIVAEAEANGLGFLSWSWDDNNLNGGLSDDGSFSHSYNGEYNSTADLTIFGKTMVPLWDKLATPSSIFQ